MCRIFHLHSTVGLDVKERVDDVGELVSGELSRLVVTSVDTPVL